MSRAVNTRFLTMKNKMEILAPAGGPDSVIAAVRSGADAVYVGAKLFSARAHAANFDTEELDRCVRYCHARGVRVYLALNTILFDDEIDAALELLKAAARADIDAVIIQDMGLVMLARQAIPDLRLHASTQMTVHTPQGAKALWELGFKRVVLSRELSLDEIRKIREFVPEVELEVFVHGALCMCVSGQCYFSAMLGGRSANRGMCAQPCRLPIRFDGNDHALSLKDNSAIEWLDALAELGVTSAKIEGRMKRPEYVATAVAACVQKRDYGAVDAQTAQRLRSVFARSGFTDGYISGERGAKMFGYRQKEDVLSAQPKLLREIRNTYKNERQSVDVTMHLTATISEPVRLVVSDGTHTVDVCSDTPAQPAQNLPLSEEKARQSLGKTGGTPFFAKEIACEIGDRVSVPAAALNALRRDALEQLSAAREQVHDYEIRPIGTIINSDEVSANGDMIVGCGLNLPQNAKEYALIFADIDAMEDGKVMQLLREGVRLGVEIPRVMFGTESKIERRLRELAALGVRDAMAHNIGAVRMAQEVGLRVHAGFGLNIANSYALEFYRQMGVKSAELSLEIDEKRIERLHKGIPTGIFSYGYAPLMIARNAPAGAEESCRNNAFLQDRKNEKFRIQKHGDAYEVFNCVPHFAAESAFNFSTGIFRALHFFVDNSVDNMEKSLEKFSENREPERFTRGLYGRGVKKFTIY